MAWKQWIPAEEANDSQVLKQSQEFGTFSFQMRQSVGKQHMHLTQNCSETLLIAQNTDRPAVSQQKWHKLKLSISVFSEGLKVCILKKSCGQNSLKTCNF